MCAADADSDSGFVRMRSGRRRRPTLFFHNDWRARADDAELRSATAASTTDAGQLTAGVRAAAAVSDARAAATVAILRRHRDAIQVVMSTTNYTPDAGARALVAALSRARRR